MYPPSHAKVPPVRPRSSLSTDEHHRIKDTHHGERNPKEPSNALLTLAGFCVFLFVLCSFLLGALVYVGRHIANDNSTSAIRSQVAAEMNLTDSEGRFVYAIPSGDTAFNHRMLLSTKPIVRFRPTIQSDSYSAEVTEDSVQASSNNSATMVTSKIVQQLSSRLPRELRPKHYWLRLRPHFDTKTFAGNVTIRLEVLKPISFIPVHAKLLTVSTEHVVHISKDNEKKTNIKPYLTFEHPELEYWVTEFAQPLDVGDYELKLEFRGSLADRIVGFYQSSYLDKQRQQQRWIATSKFEPTYARQAFPCFDEPAKKAVFEITLVVPTGDGYHALSNMNIMNENVVGDTTEVNFSPSVPMSTYLSCFIVSDFAHQAKTVRGSVAGASDFEMRVFSTKAQVNKVKYALDTGVGIIEYYIKYFNLRYPLPKLDMAAIPDFVSGAMEHWGLVTYRETALLYDKTISSSENKQRVATVVAHELAHMWFGNLVTMKWWNDLWLNEGFASYIEYKGVNEVHPDWNMLDQFLIHDLHGVMKLDSTLASHPIVQTVEKPSQITELFDSITYSKGASVIRMLEDLVGEVKFREATTSYLSEFMFENAETDDFLAEVEAKAFGFDVKLIMQTWTEQMGLPVVEVTQNGPSSYKLTQKRFFSNPGDYNATFAESQFNYRWSIPITYYTSDSNEVQRSIFNYNDQEMVVTLPNAVDWIKFNRNQTGYYRVNYPTEMWRALITTLLNGSEKFSISDRAHLVSDAFALADASQLDYKIALDLSKYLKNEREYVPWNVGIGHLKSIKNLLYYTTIYGDFLQYSRDLLQKAYDDVTWNVDDDNHLKNLLRVNILSAACAFGHEAALEEAADRFTAWLAQPANRPHPDIRSTVYYYGMQAAGNEHNWNKVWQLFVDEGDAQEKIKLMSSLAAIKEPWILQRYIILTWNKTYVRDQDYFTVLQYISLNPAGQSLVWDYVRTNWQQLVDRFGINERYLGRLIPGITKRFATSMKLDEMQAFFSKYPDAGAGTAARAEALETVKYNIKWLEENTAKVSDWLSKQKAPLVEVSDENRILKK